MRNTTTLAIPVFLLQAVFALSWLFPQAQGSGELSILGPIPEESMLLSEKASRKIFIEAGLPAPIALQVAVPAKTAQPWDLQMMDEIATPIPAGRMVGVAFYARSLDGDGEFTVKVQKKSAPYNGPLSKTEKPGKEWKCYGYFVKTGEAMASANLAFHLGAKLQRLEFCGITAVLFPENIRSASDIKTTPEELIRRQRPAGSVKPGRYILQDAKLNAHLRATNAILDQGLLFLDATAPGEIRLRDGKADCTNIPVANLPFTNALRVRIEKKSRNPWDQQLVWFSIPAVKRGDVLWVSLWLRQAGKPNQKGQVQAVLQLAEPPWSAGTFSGFPELEVESTWKEYFFAVPISTRDFPAGKMQFGLNFGLREQTVELGGFAAFLFPASKRMALPRTVFPLRYEGREKNAQWRFDALERIEKYRKGDFELRLMTRDKKPVVGAEVLFQQVRSDFGWGTAVTAKMIGDPSPTGEKYREILKKNFTKAVLENDLKWHNWENGASRAATSNAVAWLRESRIPVRGHCLVWPSWHKLPAGLRALENDKTALSARIRERIQTTMGAFQGQLVDWDVVNEPWANFDLLNIFGTNIMGEWFRLAREADPSAVLWLNDYDQIEKDGRETAHQDYLEKIIRDLRAKGAPVDGLGFQAHFKAPLTAPSKVYEILDRYARLGVKVQVTEFDIATDDEQAQADYTRDLMTVVFSHPDAVGFVNWGFWEGSHWIPEGAYWRTDFSPKPNALVWEDLVTRKFRTEERGVTDANGYWKVRGFIGAYLVTVTLGNKKVSTPLRLDGSGVLLALPF